MTEYLNKEQLNRYKQIYMDYYGVELSDSEAYQQGIALVTLISTILKNINIKNKGNKNANI